MYDLTMALVDYEVEFAFEQEPTIIIVAPLQLDSSGVRCQDLVSGVMRSIAIDGNRWHMGINQVESSDMRQESPEGSRITPGRLRSFSFSLRFICRYTCLQRNSAAMHAEQCNAMRACDVRA